MHRSSPSERTAAIDPIGHCPSENALHLLSEFFLRIGKLGASSDDVLAETPVSQEFGVAFSNPLKSWSSSASEPGMTTITSIFGTRICGSPRGSSRTAQDPTTYSNCLL